MEHIVIFLKFISIIFGFGLLISVNQLRTRYKQTFLDYYFSFYLFSLLSLLFQLATKYAATNLLMGGDFSSFLALNLAYIVSLLGFTLLSAYSYVLMTLRFLHEESEKPVGIIFSVISGALILVFLFFTRIYLLTKSSLMISSFSVVSVKVLLFIMILSNIRLLLSLGRIRSKQRTSLVLILAAFYTLLFAFHLFTFQMVITRQAGIPGALYYLLLNGLPLLLIRRLSDNYFGQLIHDDKKEERLQALFGEKNISKRESEIIRYVCEGMSNKQIAWDLSLSEQTVKHHIYNIYQKFGINSRVELINIIHAA
ncbi:MAG TPA: helix-turn-helix transcriptional regulator [Candidatus Mcinerneyibacteriales bacterium]|nr:helix-turn-helix transcriptional regulator [Candidatus Mcinerneyibacteriales bacterium]HPE20288.1 helix-turn-helix transcriptional regulator [Candidatus Mcinerneyibacteriales bacterium]HPQ89283.1 helix-turn-helix transcriptional regulator [Candidatus Mcinerneyibacteriales bacterium]